MNDINIKTLYQYHSIRKLVQGLRTPLGSDHPTPQRYTKAYSTMLDDKRGSVTKDLSVVSEDS